MAIGNASSILSTLAFFATHAQTHVDFAVVLYLHFIVLIACALPLRIENLDDL